jgi:hypothetical protein
MKNITHKLPSEEHENPGNQQYSKLLQELILHYSLKTTIVINEPFNGVIIETTSSQEIVVQTAVEKIHELNALTASAHIHGKLHLVIVVPQELSTRPMLKQLVHNVLRDYGYVREHNHSELTSFWTGEVHVTLTGFSHVGHLLYTQCAVMAFVGHDNLYLELAHIRTLMFLHSQLKVLGQMQLCNGYIYTNAKNIEIDTQLVNYVTTI